MDYKIGDKVVCHSISKAFSDSTGNYQPEYADEDDIKVGKEYTISMITSNGLWYKLMTGSSNTHSNWWHPASMFEESVNIGKMLDELDIRIENMERNKK